MENGVNRQVLKVEEDRTLKVVSRGGTLYLYVPKDLARFCELQAGDFVSVRIKKIIRDKTNY